MKRILMLVLLLVGGIMAGPVLADVEDGVTAVAEASVNQYKTAILLVAGAGWDAATDLDLEEASDEIIAARGGLASLDTRLDVSLDNAGTIKAGAVNKQTMMALDSAAAASGDAVRYDEFAAQHTNSSGAHRLDVAIVTKQAQVALDSASAATGDAVRHDEFTQEHAAAGGHSAGIIDVVEMAAGALSGKGNTAARPAAAKAGYLYVNTQTAALERDTGAAFEEVTGVISAAHVADLTDGGDTALHTHTFASLGFDDCFYSQKAEQASAGLDAPALQVFEVTGATGTTPVTVLRAAYAHRAGVNQVSVSCHVHNTNAVEVGGRLRIMVSGGGIEPLTATVAIPAGFDDKKTLKVNVSSLTDATNYEVVVLLFFDSATTGSILLYNTSLWRAGPTP